MSNQLTKEIQCKVCSQIIQNVRGFSQHLKFKHKLSYKEYHLKFNLPYKDHKPILKEYHCKLCNELINKRGLGCHLKRIHPTVCSAQNYYDKFYKKENEDTCIICGKKTSFSCLSIGYLVHCSMTCKTANKELLQKQIQSYKLSLKNDPTIIERQKTNRKITYDNDPNIQINSTIRRKHTYDNDPNIQINAKKKQKAPTPLFKRNAQNLSYKQKKIILILISEG